MNNQKGINNSCYRHGKTLIRIRCIDCGKKLGRLAFYCGTKKCKSCSAIEFKLSKEQLFGEYIINHKSITQIGNEYQYSYCTIYKWLLKYKIQIKSQSESHVGIKRPEHSKLMMGINNPNFNNWSSLEPYSSKFTKSFKEEIRDRDNHECQICYKTEKQELDQYNRKLNIHHIDYNKQNCNEENLITLCDKCHCRTNFNRDYWFTYFTELLKGAYNLCR